jgi:hypothetical protein
MTSLDVHRLETCELVAWEDLFRAAPADLAEEAGITFRESEHGLIGCVSSADVLALNRVLGLGVRCDAPADAALNLIAEYDSRAISRFFVPVSPAAGPRSLSSDLLRYGLKPYNNWIRMARETSEAPHVESTLEIREIGPDHATAFGELVCRNFGWPGLLAGWIASTVGRPNWQHYAAFDGNALVATAAMFKRGRCMWFDLATTDEKHRGKGAQSGLLAVRLRDARLAGCDLATMETAEPKEGVSAPSFRNAVRLGFEPVYARPNYIWERGLDAG